MAWSRSSRGRQSSSRPGAARSSTSEATSAATVENADSMPQSRWAASLNRGASPSRGRPDGRELAGKAGPERLGDPLERGGIVPAGGQQHAGVEQVRPRSVGRRGDAHDAVDRRPEFRGRIGLARKSSMPAAGTARGLHSASAPSGR